MVDAVIGETVWSVNKQGNGFDKWYVYGVVNYDEVVATEAGTMKKSILCTKHLFREVRGRMRNRAIGYWLSPNDSDSCNVLGPKDKKFKNIFRLILWLKDVYAKVHEDSYVDAH